MDRPMPPENIDEDQIIERHEHALRVRQAADITVTLRIVVKWWVPYALTYVCSPLEWFDCRTLAAHIAHWVIKRGVTFEEP